MKAKPKPEEKEEKKEVKEEKKKGRPGRKKNPVQRMTIVHTPVIMEFN